MITRNVNETHLVGFLLELFDGSFIDSTAFVDQMASGSRFSRIYVTDDNDVDMNLFLCHCCALDLLLLDEMIWDSKKWNGFLTLKRRESVVFKVKILYYNLIRFTYTEIQRDSFFFIKISLWSDTSRVEDRRFAIFISTKDSAFLDFFTEMAVNHTLGQPFLKSTS